MEVQGASPVIYHKLHETIFSNFDRKTGGKSAITTQTGFKDLLAEFRTIAPSGFKINRTLRLLPFTNRFTLMSFVGSRLLLY